MQPYDISGPRLKIRRAIYHIETLKQDFHHFLAQNPYALRAERGGSLLHVFCDVRQPLPEHFPLAIGDATHNLRSALDLLACALVAVQGRNPSRASFPFGSDENEFCRNLENRLRGAGDAVCHAIRDLRPYRGGNMALEGLRQLDNADKHRVILTTAQVAELPLKVVGGGIFIDCRGFDIPNEVGRRTFIRIEGGTAEVIVGGALLPHLRFGKSEIFSGKDVFGTLDRLSIMVEQIVNHLWAIALREASS